MDTTYFKERLEKEKERLEAEKKSMKDINDYGSSEDANTFEFEEREERLGLGSKINLLLAEVKNSLKQIEDGSYGVCKTCGEKIEVGRLKIFPTATLCSTCASKKKRK